MNRNTKKRPDSPLRQLAEHPTTRAGRLGGERHPLGRLPDVDHVHLRSGSSRQGQRALVGGASVRREVGCDQDATGSCHPRAVRLSSALAAPYSCSLYWILRTLIPSTRAARDVLPPFAARVSKMA